MFFSTVELPEPFRSALAAGGAATVCDCDAASPEALFGRAQARIAVGRDLEARADLVAATGSLPEACRIELAWLDLRAGIAGGRVASALRELAEQPTLPMRLQARAWHVLGLAEGKSRRTPAAVDALLKAAQLYRAAGLRLAETQVFDTLGTVEAARGRLDNALHFYAMSLVDKALLGDRAGMALTLGNIGRVHLRAGRYQQARDCFERDLEMAVASGDDRGQARMLEDLGRALLGLGDLAGAEQQLTRCLALADAEHFEDLQFFARKDLALTRLAQHRMDEAEAELAALRAWLRLETEPYLRFVLEAAEGEVLLARNDPRAVEILEDAADGFARAQLPDLEISTRIALAKALLAQKLTALAEESLLRGIRLARSDGYMRYLPVLNEAMAEMELVEGAIEEQSRAIEAGPSAAESSYIVRERLGGGAFGEVFRAYDPQRCQEVAVKRLKLDRLYDVSQRRRILASARVELEAASRVRHPGVVRVLALGTEPDGVAYVVQEFVPGRSLRALMPQDATSDPGMVLKQLQQIAGALSALHEAGVIHRDLKPENILVREDGSLVLVDFGIAHVTGSRVTDADHIAGTVAYMAPEQAAGKRLDGRADLYALGVIGYEWLTGTRPLRPRGESFREIAKDLASREPPPITEFRPGLEARIANLVMALMEKNPRRRPGSAAEVAGLCEELVVCDQ
ncbi:MAG: protein kinase [Planctomycetes bacterium]|nr:protein kinase [Planctomycetota bacterium]